MFAGKIKELNFSGQTSFRPDYLKQLCSFEPGSGTSSAKLQTGIKRILGELQQSGYLMAVLKEEYSEDSSVVAIKIEQGDLCTMDHLLITGNKYIGQAYLSDFIGAKPGGIFLQEQVSEDINNLARVYAENGYPHASVTVSDFSLMKGHISYNYQITEGPRVIIDKILFRDNKQTNYNTMLRLSGLKEGMPFSPKAVEEGRKRLMKSNLFQSVGGPLLFAGQREGFENLVITVKEGRYNSILGAIGYNQGNDQEKGWLTGSFDLAFANIGGTGRRAKVSWQRLRQESSRLSAEFSTPWIFSLNMGITAAVSHRLEDSTYTQSTGRIMADFPAGEHFTAGVGAEAVRVVPGTTQLIKKNMKYSSLWYLEADYRDSDNNQRGFLSKLEIEYGQKKYYEPSVQLTVSRIKLDGSQLWNIFSRQSLSLAGHGRVVVSSEKPVPRSDQFVMGGANSLRGYWEEQFIANQLAWTNLEYRYSPDRRLELFPFYDLGYFYDQERGQRGYRSGYGAGFRMETALGWINLVYGLGKGDKWGQGKVHIGINSDF